MFSGGPALVGGEGVSRNNRVLRNYCDTNLMCGYTWSEAAVDYEVRDNVVVNAGLVYNHPSNLKESGNVEYRDANAKRPAEPRTVQLPNRYDPNRAHLIVLNWPGGAAEVAAKVGGFLKAGERFKLLSPTDVFGKPVLEGAVQGETIAVPTPKELNAFVLIKGE